MFYHTYDIFLEVTWKRCANKHK